MNDVTPDEGVSSSVEVHADEFSDDDNEEDASEASSWSMHEDLNEPVDSRQVTFEDNPSTRHSIPSAAAELPQIQSMIQFLITTLYKLPIRRPAALERLKSKLSGQASFYQHYDVLFVRDLFPQLDYNIALRLGRLLSLRRHMLAYRHGHSEHIQPQHSEDGQNHDDRPQPSAATTPIKIPGAIDKFAVTIAPSVRTGQQSASQPESRPSKATTHRRLEGEGNFLYPPSIAPSETSRASSYAVKQLRVTIPSRPADQHGRLTHFLCPYCAITQHIKSDLVWRKHVFDDLQPYVCTYAGCGLEDHYFANKNQWFQHEIQEHRLAWHCNNDGHAEHNSQDDFVRHMLHEHQASFSPEEAVRMSSMFKRPSRSSEGTCNLCFRFSRNLKSHVARHLQRIALFALPRPNEVATSNSDRAQESHMDKSTHGIDSTSVSENDLEDLESLAASKQGWLETNDDADQPDLDLELVPTEPPLPESEDPEWHLITGAPVIIDSTRCEYLLALLEADHTDDTDTDTDTMLHELGLELKRLQNRGLLVAVEKALYELRQFLPQLGQVSRDRGRELTDPFFWHLFIIKYDLVSFVENHWLELGGINLLSPALRLDTTSYPDREPDPLTVDTVLKKGVDIHAFDHRIGAVPWYEFLKRIWELRDTADDFRRQKWFEVTEIMVRHGAIIHIDELGPSVEGTLEDLFGLQRLTMLMDAPRPDGGKRVTTSKTANEREDYGMYNLNISLEEEHNLERAIWLSLQPDQSHGESSGNNPTDSHEVASEDEEELLERAIQLSLQVEEEESSGIAALL